MNKYVIYTDGACRGNPGEGASVYVILEEKEVDIVKSNSFYYSNCTNNYAELKAIFESLEVIKNEFLFDKNLTIAINSDSKYCIDGINKWMYGWKKKGSLKDRPNGELWHNIYYLIQIIKREISTLDFIYVKGHSKVYWNEYCDKLANKAIDEHEK